MVSSLLLSVAPLVDSWLQPSDRMHLNCCSKHFAQDRKYLFWPILPLHGNPGTKHHRRLHGFGRSKTGLSTAHDQPGYELISHHIWEFLDNDDHVALTRADPILSQYADLRLSAFQNRHQMLQLRHPRPPIDDIPPLCPKRAQTCGAALLSFDFVYGDFARWLGGEYTNSHRDWTAYEQQVEEYRHQQSIPGHPPLDCDRLLAIHQDGVPLQGQFECKREDLLARLKYDNHPQLKTAIDDVRAAFTKEEASSYHIHFPKFLARFIFGLFLCPISWLIQKGKGRLIIDASTKLSDNDTGAPNSYIPKCGTPGKEDECPPVYYGDALKRHLKQVYNLRIEYPDEDLLQHTDDINAAFRRGTYHCDMAIVFAYVFMEFLLIPVGMIFGARNSPSWWDILAEWRSHLGTTKDYSTASFPIVDNVQLIPEPPDEVRAAIPIAIADSKNHGIPDELKDRGHIAMFVDDNCTVNIRTRIIHDINAAVGSAYDCFGSPETDRRLPCLRDEKFDIVAHFCVLFLGYEICTRLMRLMMPQQKQQALKDLLATQWLPRPPCTTIRPKSPKDIAILLGHVRNAALVFPLGNFISIRLTQILTTAMLKAGVEQTTNKNWWNRSCIQISSTVVPDIQLLYDSFDLSIADQTVSVWSRPIACLIPRDSTAVSLSDAAYTGMGGWSPEFNFLWRLTNADLVACGFDMKVVAKYKSEPIHHDDKGLHINILEFIALIINLWMSIHFIRKQSDKPGGHVLLLEADNTSALSWLRHAARCHSLPVRNLAFFAHALFIFSGVFDYTQLNSSHIAGKSNVEADACSRPELFPSLDSAIEHFSRLQTCQPYLLPFGLLSAIATIMSSHRIEGTLEKQMTALMTLAPHTSSRGYTASTGSMHGFYKRSRRSKHSR